MSVYIYCIRENYRYQSSITGREFENDWVKLCLDGAIIIKGINSQGYAWDGCSPKFKIKDIYIGVPEAVLNFGTGQSKTYYASLVHDVFYQFSKKVRLFIKRKEVDREFYAILKRDGFRFAGLYYFFCALVWVDMVGEEII
ncbi:MAG: hypothetical protein Q7S42_03555 [Candidatus Omnitrophota bacterium]|nr:hypothetical protein [Candidatus Omnitrophota bacterium]